MDFMVIEPQKENKRRWRLTPRAEDRVSQVGREIENMIDVYGRRQRRLRFEDGQEFWYYPCWLRVRRAE